MPERSERLGATFQQCRILLAERIDLVALDVDQPAHDAVDANGHDDLRPRVAERCQIARVDCDVADDDRLMTRDRRAGQALTDREAWMCRRAGAVPADDGDFRLRDVVEADPAEAAGSAQNACRVASPLLGRAFTREDRYQLVEHVPMVVRVTCGASAERGAVADG